MIKTITCALLVFIYSTAGLAFVPESLASTGITVRKDSTVELVMFTSPNCPYCTGWKAENLGPRGKLEGSTDWAFLRFTEVPKAWRALINSNWWLPQHLKEVGLADQLAERKHAIASVRAPTPSFVLLIDGVVVASAAGTREYDGPFLDLVRAAVAAKRQ